MVPTDLVNGLCGTACNYKNQLAYPVPSTAPFICTEPKGQSQVHTLWEKEKEKEEILCVRNKETDFTFRLLFPFIVPETTDSKQTTVISKRKKNNLKCRSPNKL